MINFDLLSLFNAVVVPSAVGARAGIASSRFEYLSRQAAGAFGGLALQLLEMDFVDPEGTFVAATPHSASLSTSRIGLLQLPRHLINATK